MSGYRVSLADLDFYQQTVACQFAFLMDTDPGDYVTAIYLGEYKSTYLITC
jgi:hypothetical protein